MKTTVINVLSVILIPMAYAIILRLIFGVESWSKLFGVMTISFLVTVPLVTGFQTVYLSKYEKTKSLPYCIFAPWVPILAFFIITLLLSIEGWACWVMILPVFLIVSSLGGLTARRKKAQKNDNKLKMSAVLLLPFLLSPLEMMVKDIPGTYNAYTFIDIEAPAEVIWNNVTRVKEISLADDKGYLTQFLGFPRPLRAELNFEGVGAYREAIFTKGLVFHETVTEYEDNKKMVFNIKANPHEIPATTLDEHVVIGGDFFDVLNGTYELEPLSNGVHRLHLYSHFEVNTTFNFYAGWWAKMIMKDIQNNILQVQKKRAEAK